MKKVIKIFDAGLAFVMSIIFAFVGVGQYILPSTIYNIKSDKAVFENIYSLKIESDKTNEVDLNVNPNKVNTQTAQIKLFGVIPVMNTTVKNTKRQYVVPGGQCFGIKLYTEGVIVVGTGTVETEQGTVSPADEAGIKVGDIITKINGDDVNTSEQVQEFFRNSNGKPVQLQVKRDNKYINVDMKLVRGTDDVYKAGMWVRDSTAGVGTITFFNIQNGTFAGLGHAINDVDTKELMPLLSGEAVKASITNVYKGKEGETGSLCCDFLNDTIGKLITNQQDGIFGNYYINCDSKDALPVATRQEVQKGPAQIISTVDGTTPVLYDVEIERVNYSSDVNQKNMVIKVTDPRLLEKTGGIVQGMSGSPIIQNGMLIGAVTHVFVNNPQKGYAIFAENMVETSNSLE